MLIGSYRDIRIQKLQAGEWVEEMAVITDQSPDITNMNELKKAFWAVKLAFYSYVRI